MSKDSADGIESELGDAVSEPHREGLATIDKTVSAFPPASSW